MPLHRDCTSDGTSMTASEGCLGPRIGIISDLFYHDAFHRASCLDPFLVSPALHRSREFCAFIAYGPSTPISPVAKVFQGHSNHVSLCYSRFISQQSLASLSHTYSYFSHDSSHHPNPKRPSPNDTSHQDNPDSSHPSPSPHYVAAHCVPLPGCMH